MAWRRSVPGSTVPSNSSWPPETSWIGCSHQRTQSPGRCGAGISGDEDDLLVILGDGQHVAVDPEPTGPRMSHRLHPMARSVHRILIPDPDELLARPQLRQQTGQA